MNGPTPPESHGRAAEATLRAVVALSALTAAWQAWHQPSTVNGVLFMELGQPAELARLVDRGAALLLAVAGAAVGLRGSRPAALLIALWLLALAIARTVGGGTAFAHLAVPAQAVRFAAPVCLVLLASSAPRGAELLLRLAAAATFAVHGWEALQHTPSFVDLVILSARNHLDLRIGEDTTRLLLTAIGWADLALAAAVLLRRWRWAAAYMAIWGALTLTSRMTAHGHELWPEAAIRVANAGVPLALFLLWGKHSRTSGT